MDGERFDRFAKTLVRASTRRGLLRPLVGGALGVAALRRGQESAAAACVAAGKRCKKGDECCTGSTCKGGTCKCKFGLTACGKTCKPCCVDGLRNGQESDVDCGGGCARCADGNACAGRNDCRSALCDTGLCRACSTSTSKCGSDTTGSCFCITSVETNEKVCITNQPSANANTCNGCPRGTHCYVPSSGPKRCYRPCGAS